MRPVDDDEHLLLEAEKIVVAIGRMFPGLCEVVLHDLRDPRHAIRAIENNLSGRRVGDPATELGFARVADSGYPSVVQNYPNTFSDGRPAKSTSIGIKNRSGTYIGALCLNLDVSTLSPMTLTLANLVATEDDGRTEPVERLHDRTTRELRDVIERYAARHAASPRALSRREKRRLVRQLHYGGYFETRRSTEVIAGLLGVSRSTVYNYARQAD